MTSENKLPDELRQAIRRNATSVRMATANGPTTAKDVVDIEVPGLDASARVLLLEGCPPVLSLGRLVDEHHCSFRWDQHGAVLTDHLGQKHECVIKNFVPFLNASEYAFPVDAAPDPEEAPEGLLEGIMPEGNDEAEEETPGILHDLTH